MLKVIEHSDICSYMYIQLLQVQENIRELEKLLKEPFQQHSTLQASREQLDYYQPVFRKLHESHDQCKSHGKQFLDLAASAKRRGRSYEHVSKYVTINICHPYDVIWFVEQFDFAGLHCSLNCSNKIASIFPNSCLLNIYVQPNSRKIGSWLP